MNHSDSDKLNGSVRLFPRLAASNKLGQVSRRRVKLAGRSASGLPNADPIASVRAQVRSRLLKMILDNEQVRQNERRGQG
jgi:hypothetical protein